MGLGEETLGDGPVVVIVSRASGPLTRIVVNHNVRQDGRDLASLAKYAAKPMSPRDTIKHDSPESDTVSISTTSGDPAPVNIGAMVCTSERIVLEFHSDTAGPINHE
jgi:hypothetical protein